MDEDEIDHRRGSVRQTSGSLDRADSYPVGLVLNTLSWKKKALGGLVGFGLVFTTFGRFLAK